MNPNAITVLSVIFKFRNSEKMISYLVGVEILDDRHFVETISAH